MSDISKRIEPPIERDLADNPGLVRFDTYNQVLDWAERELAAWRCLADNRDALPPISSDPALQRQEAIPHQIAAAARHALAAESAADLSEVNRRITNALARYANVECLHAATPRGRLVLTLLSQDPPAAVAFLAATTGMHINVVDRGRRAEHDLLPLVHAMSRATLAAYGGPTALKIEDTAFQEVRDRWESRLAEKETTLESVATDVAQWLASQKAQVSEQSQTVTAIEAEHRRTLAAHKQRIAQLEADYAQRLGLRGAIAHWVDLRRRHRLTMVISATMFAAVATAMLYAVAFFAVNGEAFIDQLPGIHVTFPAESVAAGILPPVATTIALGVFILLGIWILQVISRLFLFSAAAANDAGARIAMVQTYLALANETPNTMAADRQVILHSLFGPDHSFGDQSGHQ